jgi:hypothetical protein
MIALAKLLLKSTGPNKPREHMPDFRCNSHLVGFRNRMSFFHNQNRSSKQAHRLKNNNAMSNANSLIHQAPISNSLEGSKHIHDRSCTRRYCSSFRVHNTTFRVQNYHLRSIHSFILPIARTTMAG